MDWLSKGDPKHGKGGPHHQQPPKHLPRATLSSNKSKPSLFQDSRRAGRIMTSCFSVLVFAILAMFSSFYVGSQSLYLMSTNMTVKAPYRYTDARVIDIPGLGLFALRGDSGSQHFVANGPTSGLYQGFSEPVGEVCETATIRDIIVPEYLSTLTTYAGTLLNVPVYAGHGYGLMTMFMAYTWICTLLAVFDLFVMIAFSVQDSQWIVKGFTPLRYLHIIIDSIFLILVAAPLIGITDVQTKTLLILFHFTVSVIYIVTQLFRSDYLRSAATVPAFAAGTNATFIGFSLITILLCGQAYNWGLATVTLPTSLESVFTYDSESYARIFVLLIFIVRGLYFGIAPFFTQGWLSIDTPKERLNKSDSVESKIFFWEEISFRCMVAITVIAGVALLMQLHSLMRSVDAACSS